MKLILRLLALLGHPACGLPAQSAFAPETLILEDGTMADEDGPRGCGWFDSSHELHRGLSVCEHASPDSLARELPLPHWLDLQLSGWNPCMSAAPAV